MNWISISHNNSELLFPTRLCLKRGLSEYTSLEGVLMVTLYTYTCHSHVMELVLKQKPGSRRQIMIWLLTSLLSSSLTNWTCSILSSRWETWTLTEGELLFIYVALFSLLLFVLFCLCIFRESVSGDKHHNCTLRKLESTGNCSYNPAIQRSLLLIF